LSLFITFEGGEGSGKSTQARVLHQRLSIKGIPALLTHEPGGTPLGQQIRRWLKGTGDIDPQAELLLFNASRAQLVATVIRPALKSGIVVICDRFYHSTIAYQGYGRGFSLELIQATISFATGGLKPDLTILLETAFHQRVRNGYLEMANKDPERWLVINGSLRKKEIERIIRERIEQLLTSGRFCSV
jgi:dTMP kinase